MKPTVATNERGVLLWNEVQEGEVIATWTWDGTLWETVPEEGTLGAQRTMTEMAECLLVTRSSIEPMPAN
jgi:hypothetical protein